MNFDNVTTVVESDTAELADNGHLLFRTGPNLTAAYATGIWHSFKEIDEPVQNAPAKELTPTE